MDFVHLSADLLLYLYIYIIIIINNLKFTIMKLLMTVQPRNGEKPSEPMLIDTDESSLFQLAENFLHSGDKILVFQPVSEYHARPHVGCCKQDVKL
nr:MAG TPA: hypothetical protein [Microviridae sp.]